MATIKCYRRDNVSMRHFIGEHAFSNVDMVEWSSEFSLFHVSLVNVFMRINLMFVTVFLIVNLSEVNIINRIYTLLQLFSYL